MYSKPCQFLPTIRWTAQKCLQLLISTPKSLISNTIVTKHIASPQLNPLPKLPLFLSIPYSNYTSPPNCHNGNYLAILHHVYTSGKPSPNPPTHSFSNNHRTLLLRKCVRDEAEVFLKQLTLKNKPGFGLNNCLSIPRCQESIQDGYLLCAG